MECLVRELVASSHVLARLLLRDGECASADACAAAVLPQYPCPPAAHCSWQGVDGQALRVLASRLGLSLENLHKSPQAAVRVLFDASWRRHAAHACAERVCTLDNVVGQFCKERECSAAYARLQLAAATKICVDELDGDHLYVTRQGNQCFVLHGGIVVEQPTDATFVSMQDDLSLDEQLQFLLTSNDMVNHFLRAAQGEPLPLAQEVCECVMPPLCLSFCSICTTNWCVDCEGRFSTFLQCEHDGCLRFAHRTCCGNTTFRCIEHTETCKKRHDAVADNALAVAPALGASGLVACQGAWCVAVAEWPGIGRCFGCLHPLSLEYVYRETDRRVAAGTWQSPSCTPSARSGKLHSVIRVLHALGHRLCTARASMSHSPAPTTLGQRVLPASTWQLSPGLGATLCALQVYADFHNMCVRFLQSGATVDSLDDKLFTWLQKRLPILSGRWLSKTTSSDHAQPSYMHEQAWAALLSPRVMDRCKIRACHAEHWVAAQVDAVYPTSAEEDALMMKALGLQVAATHFVPFAPAKPRADCSHRQMHEPVSTYPVHMMLNPSLHVAAVCDVLHRMTGIDVEGTLDVLFKHEIKPFARMTPGIVAQFRHRCIRHACYGTMYLFMLVSGVAEDGIAAFEPDCTGLLPAWTSDRVTWKAKWEPVRALCECTNATYVGLECGSAAYWRCVLPGRRAFLFDVNANALQELASVPLPSSVHVVPVRTDDTFSLQELDAKCIVMTRRTWPKPDVSGCSVHDLTPGHKPSSAFMAQFKKCMWQHDTNVQDDQMALCAYRMMH